MAHSFTVRINDTLPSALKKVESEITACGGSFQGDTERGSFAGNSVLGTIKGEYVCLSKDEIKVTITGKPFLVPHKTIEEQIREYFA